MKPWTLYRLLNNGSRKPLGNFRSKEDAERYQKTCEAADQFSGRQGSYAIEKPGK